MHQHPELTNEDRRSHALNAAALERVLSDWPAYLPHIRRDLDTMRRAAAGSPAYLDRIEGLIERGPEALREAFLRCDGAGQVLRSVHPFAGILDPRERTAIIHATRRSLP